MRNTDLSNYQAPTADLTSNADGPGVGYTSPTGEWSMFPPSASGASSTTPPAASGKAGVWDALTAALTSAGTIFGKPQQQIPQYGYPTTPYYGTNPNAMSTGAVVGLSIAGLVLVGTVIYFATKK